MPSPITTATISKALLARALKATGLNGKQPYSNIKRSEQLIFFNTTAWLDPTTEQWNIPIHGWVYEPNSSWALRGVISQLLQRKYGLKVSAANKNLFNERLNLFTVGNEQRKRVIIELKGQLYELPKSSANGQFEGIIKLPKGKVRGNKQGLTTFSAALKPGDQREFIGKVQLLKPTGVSVISDIDDTVKLSYINDRKRMFEAAFFQPFAAVKGMPEVYQQWQQQGAALHFVSSSPWQLYQPLAEFMHEFGFPWASFSLKKVRIKDETILNLFKSGLVTKPIAIKTIFERYPERKFVLVGDSGEQDAQAYAQIARQHPEQVAKIFIRNVHRSKTLNKEYGEVFRGLPRRLWTTFHYPSQIRFNISS